MRSLQNITQHAQQHGLPTQPNQRPTQAISAESATFINKLFKELQAVSPRWGLAFRTDEQLALAKQRWTKTLLQHQITSTEQFVRGIAAAAADPSPEFPTVGQFIQWCIGDELDNAFYRLITQRGQPRDRAEQLTLGECAYPCRTQLSADKARTLFNKTLLRYRAAQRRGEFSAQVLEALPAKVSVNALHQQIQNFTPTAPDAVNLMARLSRLNTKRKEAQA